MLYAVGCWHTLKLYRQMPSAALIWLKSITKFKIFRTSEGAGVA